MNEELMLKAASFVNDIYQQAYSDNLAEICSEYEEKSASTSDNMIRGIAGLRPDVYREAKKNPKIFRKLFGVGAGAVAGEGLGLTSAIKKYSTPYAQAEKGIASFSNLQGEGVKSIANKMQGAVNDSIAHDTIAGVQDLVPAGGVLGAGAVGVPLIANAMRSRRLRKARELAINTERAQTARSGRMLRNAGIGIGGVGAGGLALSGISSATKRDK